jgi:NAD(P)-dependent dehydrogenase (short-subunit alcohol dehydrogenase family)
MTAFVHNPAPRLNHKTGHAEGSVSGILSGHLFGPYSMSKHAMEAFTDSLAVEMERFGVHVSVIEPGNYRSDIGKNIARRMKARGQTPEGSRYQADITIRKAIEELIQLNEYQQYRYSRDQLVQMLDEALSPPEAEASP